MPAHLDLNLLSLYRINDQEQPNLPGLLTAAPTKKAARGRDGDQLIVFLTLSGNIPFSSSDYSRLTAQLAEQFYKTPGSLTHAMRSTAENLNQFLLDRNLRSTGRGQYAIGRLLLGVLRGSQLVLIQSGPTHVFQVGRQVRHIHDAQISGRGLGLSQSTPIYFTQVDLNPDDILVLCAQLPSGWEAALQSEHGRASLEAMRQKLVGINHEDLNAAVLQAKQGNGRITILPLPRPEAGKAAPAPAKSAPEQPSPAARLANILSETRKPVQAAEAEATPPSSSEPVDEVPPELPPSSRVELPSERRTRSAPVQPQTTGQVASQETPQPALNKPGMGSPLTRWLQPKKTVEGSGEGREISQASKKILRGLANMFGLGRRLRQAVSAAMQRYLPNLLPSQDRPASSVPGGVMAVTAIIVPVIVVTIATVVYIRYGRLAQYDENYQLAVEAAVGAIGADDPSIVRHAWESALYYLDKAESYQESQQSRSLRQEAQSALDGMDGIIRLDFRPAIVGGLSKAVQISHMAATDTDLYILNATNGSVLRAILTNQGYSVDPEFKCGPGSYEGFQVGNLLDIATLPAFNTHEATLLGLDANGMLLYCAPGSDPIAFPLQPPDIAFKGLAGFALDAEGENLYVLDPPSNAVWIYRQKAGNFSDLPILFFSENPPAGMPAAIDILATADDLYLLFQDGHVTLCSISQMDVVPLRCYDPAILQDDRPGHQPGPTISDAIFTQMSLAAPPDPSLYLLVPETHAIYRFSPRPDSLELRGQFRATVEQAKLLTEPASAMAISLNRYLFLNIGNQVYFATDVP